MNKRNFFFLLLILSAFQLAAQSDVTQLETQLQKSKGKNKAKILNQLSSEYRKSDRFKSIEYARLAYIEARKFNDKSEEALSLKNEGICWFFIGNNDSAVLCYTRALDLYTVSKNKQGISACLNNLGLIAQETGNYDSALSYYRKSINIDTELGDEGGVAVTKGNIVDILIYQGNSKEALQILNEILFVQKKLNDSSGILNALSNRGAVYDYLMEFDKAIVDLKDAIKLARKLNDKYVEASTMSNLGLVLFHMNKPDEGLIALFDALSLYDGLADDYDMQNTLWIISDIYRHKRLYHLSNQILVTILKNYENSGNVKEEAKVLSLLGRNLLELNEIDKAEGYFKHSLELSFKLNARYEMLENYRNLTYTYAILHNFQAADSIQQLYAETYNGLFKSDSINSTQALTDKKNVITGSHSAPIIYYVIAFLLFVLAALFSAIAYKQNK